jgi:hypothetical protein
MMKNFVIVLFTLLVTFIVIKKYIFTNDDNEHFTTISVPKVNCNYDPLKAGSGYDRFHIQLFKETNLKNCITSLKDSPEQHAPIQVNYPIKSIRIRSSPNDLWRFTQQFSLIIYLKHDPSYKLELKLSRETGSIDYKILDTADKSEVLEWMTRYEPKIVVFTVGQYYPIDDFDNNSQEYTAPVLPLASSANTFKNDELPGNYFWI